MPIPEYFERFIRNHFNAKYVDRVFAEFIEYASDGSGGSDYTHKTVSSLLRSRDSGKLPESLGYFGS